VKIRRHFTYANVTATVALILALGGGAAYAVDKVNSQDIVNGSIRSVDLRNHKAVRGVDVRRNSLTGQQIDESRLNVSRFAQVSGNETGGCALLVTPKSCVTATFRVTRASRILVIATGNQESLGDRPAQASCQVRIDGHAQPFAVDPGEVATDNTSLTATNGFARTFVSPDRLSAGEHTVAMSCKRLIGNVRIDSPTIAAVAVGAG
jgi:hypothetical protein